MNQRTPTLAAFTATLGLLALILAVSALAEKAHGDHLPERNGRGSHTALIASGLPAGIIALLAAFSGPAAHWHRRSDTRGTTVPPAFPRCTMTGSGSAMAWPMRLQDYPACTP